MFAREMLLQGHPEDVVRGFMRDPCAYLHCDGYGIRDPLGNLTPAVYQRMLEASLLTGALRSAVAGRGGVKAGAGGFGGLSRADQFGVVSYGSMRTGLKGSGLQAHHLIEKRFAATMGQSEGSMLSVAVTKQEHQAFTNAWRKAIPYGKKGTGTATAAEVRGAAREIYRNYPSILRALDL